MRVNKEDIQNQKVALKKCISGQLTISNNILNDIVAHFEPHSLKPGELFTEPGVICKKMAYIYSGVLRMYNYVDGKEVTLWIGSKNRFITDLRSFIHEQSSRWFIEAVEPAALLTISREKHDRLTRAYQGWIEFDNLLLTNAYTIIEDRIFSHLYMSAEERFNTLFESEPALFNKVPLKQIASMLAMTPETLSRLRAKQRS